MRAGGFAEGWQGIDEAEANATATEVSHGQLLDEYLRRHGWDGQADRDRALLALLLAKDSQITREEAEGHRARIDGHFMRGKRGAGGKAAQEARKAATRALVEQAVAACRQEMLKITANNCLKHWPERQPRPTNKTVRRHLLDMGLLQENGRPRE